MNNETGGGGWLCLWRELLNKPIWVCGTLEQRVILITLLCMANHRPQKWEFGGEVYEVQAGQFITSIKSIVENCKCKDITSQKVRTALERFEKLGFLTSKSTNKNRLITIVNWRLYQDKIFADNNQNNKQITSRQQTDNKQITTNNNNNNINNDNNINNLSICDITPTPTPIPTQTPHRQKTDKTDTIDTLFVKQLKDNVRYDDMCITHKKADVDNIIDLAFDLISVSDDAVHIGGKVYPKEYVKEKLLSLDSQKVDFLIDKSKSLGEQTVIRNPKRYMQSVIFSTAINYNTEWSEYFNRTYYQGFGMSQNK